MVKNKNTLLILIAVLIIASAVLWRFNNFNNFFENYQSSPETQHQVLGELETELRMVIASSGEINPERYKEIDQRLKELESQGVDQKKINAVRALLGQLTIEGSKQQARPVATQQSQSPTTPKATANQPTQTEQTESVFSNPVAPAPSPQKKTCISNSNPVFTSYLIDPSSVINILPPPNIHKSSGHLKTHSYIDTPSDGIPLYAPVDMALIKGDYYVGGPYYFDFQVSCEVTLRLAHVINPVSKIQDAFGDDPNAAAEIEIDPIEFKAGELIAYSGGPPYTLNKGLDFGVYNATKPNRYASDPAWNSSTIYTTAVCPYDFFTAAIKSQYTAKYNLINHEGMSRDGESFCN